MAIGLRGVIEPECICEGDLEKHPLIHVASPRFPPRKWKFGPTDLTTPYYSTIKELIKTILKSDVCNTQVMDNQR